MKKHLKFYTSTLLILTVIGYIWYLSEPKYDNNHQGIIQTYDIITVPVYRFSYYDNPDKEVNVKTYMVLQKDSSTIFVKDLDGYYTQYKVLNYTKYNIHIIGHGTIYHKVNQIIGLNIMLIAQVLLLLLLFVITLKYIQLVVKL